MIPALAEHVDATKLVRRFHQRIIFGLLAHVAAVKPRDDAEFLDFGGRGDAALTRCFGYVGNDDGFRAMLRSADSDGATDSA